MLRCRQTGTSFAFLPAGVTRFFCALILLGAMPTAFAQTWNGGGGNVLWGTGANWIGGVPPTNGANITFAGNTNTGTSGTPLNQNIGAPLQLNMLTFSATAGSFFLGGNALAFTGASNSITQSSSNAQSIANSF